MSASLAPVPTPTARRALESKGYRLIDQDEYNWAFARNDHDIPIILPHNVPYVPVMLMNKYRDLLITTPTPEELSAAIAADTDD